MKINFSCIILTVLVCAFGAFGQSTEITYQGQLKSASVAANGNFDFEFLLFDSVTGGTQVGPTVERSAVPVANGLFSVRLDFGPNFPGASRYLEIHVRPNGPGTYTPLVPRQTITSTPYSIKTLSADTAANAQNAAFAANADALGGVPAGQYVQTSDPRLTDARNPTGGSSSYVQNGTSAQPGNFNLSGNGNLGGNLRAEGFVSATFAGFAGTATHDGVQAGSGAGYGVNATSSTNFGVYGSGGGGGVKGVGTDHSGVFGQSSSAPGVEGRSTSGVGLLGSSQSAVAVYGEASNNAAIYGVGQTGLYGVGFGSGPGAIAVRAQGTSWFHGDTTPLTGTAGTGIAIGTTTTDIGYIFAIDYATFASKTLALNHPGGRVGIGTLSPDQTLSVNGNASKTGGGSWLTFSDERLKNMGKNYRSGLKAVMQLQPLTYEYKKDNALGIVPDGTHVGFSAQAVQKVIPEAVTKNENGYLLVNNDPIMWTILNAIKEQQAEIRQLRKQVAELSRSKGKVNHPKRNHSGGRK